MKILVTGGLGFIGSNFIRHVLATQADAQIVNLDIQTYAGNPENLKDIAGDKRYFWVQADITDPALVGRAMSGADAVVHFAAESHVDRSILDPGPFFKDQCHRNSSSLRRGKVGKNQKIHPCLD